MRKQFFQGILKAAEQNPNIWLITADLGYSFVEEFEKKFPKRFLNVGVSEQNMMSIAAGLALEGKKVYVYSIVNFCTSFDALSKFEMTFATMS